MKSKVWPLNVGWVAASDEPRDQPAGAGLAQECFRVARCVAELITLGLECSLAFH